MANQIRSTPIGGNQWNPFSFLFGSQDRINQVPTVTPEVSSALNQLLQQGLSGIENPQAGFNPIAQEARTQFQQQTVPSIAERFSGLGAQGSSAFGQQLGAAGAGLEQNLASQGANYGLQNRQGLLQQLQLASKPQFENIHTPGSSGLFANLFGLGGLGQPLSAQGGQQGGDLLQMLAKLLPLLL